MGANRQIPTEYSIRCSSMYCIRTKDLLVVNDMESVKIHHLFISFSIEQIEFQHLPLPFVNVKYQVCWVDMYLPLESTTLINTAIMYPVITLQSSLSLVMIVPTHALLGSAFFSSKGL